MEKNIIEITELTYALKGQVVLDKINLTVNSSDFIAVIGPNGGGKTTLLKIILGLLNPTKGKIRVLGQSAKKSARLIGYVPQNIHINTSFPITALDVVLMGRLGLRRRGRSFSAEDRTAAMEALDQMAMADKARVKIGRMSGGQRQRVFISRALVTNPGLLLLDEPTASIDTKGQNDFYQTLSKLNQSLPILVVSHDLLMISNHVKAFACVNKSLHLHNEKEINGNLLECMYSCTSQEICPVSIFKQMSAPFIHHQGDNNDPSPPI